MMTKIRLEVAVEDDLEEGEAMRLINSSQDAIKRQGLGVKFHEGISKEC